MTDDLSKLKTEETEKCRTCMWNTPRPNPNCEGDGCKRTGYSLYVPNAVFPPCPICGEAPVNITLPSGVEDWEAECSACGFVESEGDQVSWENMSKNAEAARKLAYEKGYEDCAGKAVALMNMLNRIAAFGNPAPYTIKDIAKTIDTYLRRDSDDQQ